MWLCSNSCFKFSSISSCCWPTSCLGNNKFELQVYLIIHALSNIDVLFDQSFRLRSQRILGMLARTHPQLCTSWRCSGWGQHSHSCCCWGLPWLTRRSRPAWCTPRWPWGPRAWPWRQTWWPSRRRWSARRPSAGWTGCIWQLEMWIQNWVKCFLLSFVKKWTGCSRLWDWAEEKRENSLTRYFCTTLYLWIDKLW